MTGGFLDDYKFVRDGRNPGRGPRPLTSCGRLAVMRGELFLGSFQGRPETRAGDQANRTIGLLMRHHRQIPDIASGESLENDEQIFVRMRRLNFAGHDLFHRNRLPLRLGDAVNGE
jgi:hypothetical protein